MHTPAHPLSAAPRTRRHWLQALTAAGTAAALSGCGFKLRQAPNFAFKTLFMVTAVNSPLALQLRRQLEGSGQVKVVEQPGQAQVWLEVPLEQRERAVVGLNTNGEVRELQIRYRVRFRMRAADGRELIEESEVLREMDVSYSETQALAKEAEIDMLYKSMQSDVVNQMMRRLALVRDVGELPEAAAGAASAASAAR